MKDEEQEFRDHAEQQIDKIMRRAKIFSDGIESAFWKELMEMLSELEKSAFKRFTDANASDTAVIIELQQVGKLKRVLEAKVKGAIDAADHLVQ